MEKQSNLPTYLVFAAFILIIVCMVLLFMRGIQNGINSNTASAYSMVNNCILNIPATQRTQADIDNCYKEVQGVTGLELERYKSDKTK